jgi:hypothetical protein
MPNENKNFKVVTLGEMTPVFENANMASLLTLPRTADVVESMVNVISDSTEDSEYEYHSMTDTEEGLAFIFKLKQE